MTRPDCRPFLPPEWALQSGVQITWPHAHGDWAPHLPQVEPVFVAIARHIAHREKVLISCYDRAHREHVTNLLVADGVEPERVILRVAPSNDTWARDHGPITVQCRDEPLLLDFGFNGWGGKYGHALDNQLTRRLYDQGTFGNTALQTVDMILEGGSIEVDGSGTLLTTEQCLLASTRNPGMSREHIEQQLSELLGLKRFLWLRHGHLEGDDTDSHIDTLARFCDAQTIAHVACDDTTDSHYDDLRAMENELKQFTAAAGGPYRLVPLPWPKAMYAQDGRRLPATYANFLIINDAVLVPTYRDPSDRMALERLAGCFPGREIIGIDCAPLIHQYGSLHCVTMQLPAGVL